MFFREFSDNKILKKKFVNNVSKTVEEDNFENNNPAVSSDEEKIENTLENLEKVKNDIKDKILNEDVTANPFFDEQLFNHLDNLHSFISEYIPNYPKYYTKDKNNKIKINPKAFLDARDILKNEIPINAEEIINTSTSLSGVTNDSKMNFENGYQIDFDGNIYNPKKEIIFNSTNPSEKIKFLDLLNKKVITNNGIRIDMPDNFIQDYIINNELLDKNFIDKLENLQNQINKTNNIDNSTNDNSNNNSNNSSSNFASNTTIIPDIYATVNGIPISYDDKIFVEMPVEDMYIGDIYGEDSKIDVIEQIEKYQILKPSLGICNFKDIPYAELNSKLFWGGGQRGVKPLSSNNISDKDIAFAPNGTVYYSGSNSTISTRRPGCKSKTYKTGHVCMWSDTNKMGLKTSIIQYIYRFCNSFGLFNANIPMLIGFKKFKVFPGLCIGGLLEMALCGWQERISTRINEMFQCIPSKMPSDASCSLFENETFQYGASVDNLSELDKIKSCKFGDRYVVEIVDQSVSKTPNPACGVFVFDPNDKLSNLYKWKYKCWRGKPFNPRDNNTVISDFSNMYENPLVQDLLMNTNALGEDSITRKLMSLQYAFMKKQSLLAISDVAVSMDSIIETSIYEILDKLTYKLPNYISLLDLKEQLEESNSDEDSVPKGGTPISFANQFLSTYSLLIDKGILKECPLEKCLREYKKSTGSGSDGSSGGSVTIRYYDFSGYNPNEYLVPSYNNIEQADASAFAALFSPNEELKNVYQNNLEYLEKLNSNTDKYNNVTTIRDFINKSDDKDGFNKNISDNLRYIEYQLNYEEYDSRAFAQVKRRCDYAINTRKIF